MRRMKWGWEAFNLKHYAFEGTEPSGSSQTIPRSVASLPGLRLTQRLVTRTEGCWGTVPLPPHWGWSQNTWTGKKCSHWHTNWLGPGKDCSTPPWLLRHFWKLQRVPESRIPGQGYIMHALPCPRPCLLASKPGPRESIPRTHTRQQACLIPGVELSSAGQWGGGGDPALQPSHYPFPSPSFPVHGSLSPTRTRVWRGCAGSPGPLALARPGGDSGLALCKLPPLVLRCC